jgi:hypothetical protein
MADRVVRVGSGVIQSVERNERKKAPREMRW